MASPTEPPAGFVATSVDPLRYDGQQLEPEESTAMIVNSIPEGARVLDVGCGTGSISVLIRDIRKASVLGIEPNATRVQAARARGLAVIEGVLSMESARDLGPFDAIVFADVLEHLVDPAEVLSVAAPLLRSGGRIVASVPNVAHWSVRMDLLRGQFDYREIGIMDATHLRWFTRKTLTRLFESIGFRIESFQGSAGLWLWDYRQRRPWKWISSDMRRKMVLAGLKRWPGLFSCQHVVNARPVS